MSKRLRIAKKLLSARGVIFISIDDNEQANLKLLCDEIFSYSNFITKFDWRKKTGANDAKDIASSKSWLCIRILPKVYHIQSLYSHCTSYYSIY